MSEDLLMEKQPSECSFSLILIYLNLHLKKQINQSSWTYDEEVLNESPPFLVKSDTM